MIQLGSYDEFPGATATAFDATPRQVTPLHKKMIGYARDCIGECYNDVIVKRRDAWNRSEHVFWAQVDRGELSEMEAEGIPTFDDPFVLPILHTYVDATVAAEFQIYAERDPRIMIQARKATDELQIRRIEMLLNDQYQRTRGDLITLYRLIHAKVYGYSVRKTVWNKQRQLNQTYWWDPFLFFWDTNRPVTQMHEGTWVAFQSSSHYYDLLERQIYFNLDVLKEKKPAKEFISSFGYGLERAEMGGGVGTQRNRIFGISDPDEETEWRSRKKGRSLYNILHEFWFKMVPSEKKWEGVPLLPGQDPDKPVIGVATIANGQTVIRFDYADFTHGQFPGGAIAPLADGLQIAPVGVIDVNDGVQRYIDWLASSRKESVQKTLNPRTIFDPELLDYEELANPYSGQWIPLKTSRYIEDMRRAIYQMPADDVTQGHLGEMQYLQQYIERDMASTEPVQGVTSESKRSATELSIVARSAQGRHGLTVRKYDLQDYEDLVRQMYANTQRFMDREYVVRMSGDISALMKSSGMHDTQLRFVPGEFDDVEIDYMPFNPKQMVFRERRAEILRNLLAMLMQDQELAPRVNRLQFYKDISEASGEMNFDKYILDVPVTPTGGPFMAPGPPNGGPPGAQAPPAVARQMGPPPLEASMSAEGVAPMGRPSFEQVPAA